eukprot:GHVN01012316.1.p1 GENE.GHVN01012316.1~~GHVN01012316.1.p1  ORF type:complete len:168 (-),score=30.10 GHVN01012316.1:662-1165(-)
MLPFLTVPPTANGAGQAHHHHIHSDPTYHDPVHHHVTPSVDLFAAAFDRVRVTAESITSEGSVCAGEVAHCTLKMLRHMKYGPELMGNGVTVPINRAKGPIPIHEAEGAPVRDPPRWQRLRVDRCGARGCQSGCDVYVYIQLSARHKDHFMAKLDRSILITSKMGLD